MNTMNRVSGISKKYDSALDYGITMYDELPYKRNADVCNGSTVALYSGHIIKYYLCNNEEDCFLIDNHDDEIGQILLDIQQQLPQNPSRWKRLQRSKCKTCWRTMTRNPNHRVSMTNWTRL